MSIDFGEQCCVNCKYYQHEPIDDGCVLGERIDELRKQKGLSQKELAAKVGITDVSMSRYINGYRIPKGPILGNIAAALGVSTDFILGNADPGEHTPESDYYLARQAIVLSAKKWNNIQKADLVNAIFGVE